MPAMNPPPIPTAACAKCGVPTNDIQYVGGIVCKQCWNNQRNDNVASNQRLTAKTLKEWREATWLAQGKRCAITGYSISTAEAVADHCHKTGHCRAVLHRGVNSLLGKIENGMPRFGVSIPLLRAMAPAIADYIAKDYSGNPYYPTHRTEDEKRELRNKRARDARAKNKGT